MPGPSHDPADAYPDEQRPARQPSSVTLDGDRAVFQVPGGFITVTLARDGALQVYGFAAGIPHGRTHTDRLVLMPESANFLRITLAPKIGA